MPGLRLALAVAVIVISLSEAKAETACNEIGRQLFEIAVTSQALFVTEDSNRTELFASRLEHSLTRLDREMVKSDSPGAGSRAMRLRIESFTEPRRKLLELYRNEDAKSAKDFYYRRIIKLSSGSRRFTLASLDCMFDSFRTDLEKILATRNSDNLLKLSTEARFSVAGKNNASRSNKDFWKVKFDSNLSKYFLFVLVFIPIAVMFSVNYFENRKSHRHDVVIDTVVIIDGKALEIRINNISATGARFGPNPGLDVDQKISIILEDIPVLSHVRWVGDKFVGVQFAKRLKKSKFNRLKTAIG